MPSGFKKRNKFGKGRGNKSKNVPQRKRKLSNNSAQMTPPKKKIKEKHDVVHSDQQIVTSYFVSSFFSISTKILNHGNFFVLCI